VTAESCLFCRIVAGGIAAQKLYDDDLVVVFDLPQGHSSRLEPVHFIAVSREHIASARRLGDEHGRLLGFDPQSDG
jgi:diadenosine tetraphosphate (Ap4A) HIT family hydrolase